ncbi:DUF2339 domain-containing protein [Tabrizicola fusiformis]|uniref:DUF2339 domain-containing protein n=1 Tax=Tabrizicola sp. SY72 TaxID=2741673 RepID=UPI00157419B8|nr:DUF2339 domain-containing protein [Tabrizicola sp. SY72]NTT86285.1 DUF2339 domain-containing protein [Tabrizicola sp. SY72]
MDGILALLVLAVLAIPVSIIVLFAGQSGLKRRIAALEAQLAARPIPVPAQAAPATAPAAAEPAADAPPAPDEVAADTPAPAEPPTETRAETPWDRAARAVRPDLRRTPTGEPASAAPPPPKGPGPADRLMVWLRDNWVYAVSAASLALAGVFFVQYGIENGLLPPAARVAAALLFGLVLIGAGEWLRRRHGDGEQSSTAHLPSVFSGAGIVSVFAGIVAARQLYGLIGPETAFGGLMVTAAGAVALGWFSGPLLVVVGLVGAALTPFVAGDGSGAAPWLYGHYGLIAAAGLAVDKVRGWRWLSVLALVLGFGGGWLMLLAGAGVPGMVALLLLLPLATLVLAGFALIPQLDGPPLWRLAMGTVGRPAFAVTLAHGATLAASLALVAVPGAEGEAMLAFAALAVLAVLLLLWADRGEGAEDLALWPALGFLMRLVAEPMSWGGAYAAFRGQEIALRAPETAAPLTVSLLLGLGLAISAAAAFRALRPQIGPLSGLGFGLAAVLVAPLTAAGLELLWNPSPVLGAYPWALQVIALAAVMVALALRFAKADGEDRRRAAHATLSALVLIALALFLITTKTALTLALAVLALVAAALDRRFRLPEMGAFVQLAVAVLSWRLLVDPGLDWAMWAPPGQVLLAFGGTIAGLTAAWVVLRPMARTLTLGVLESAVAGHAAVLVNLLLTRWLTGMAQPGMTEAYWSLTLQALPWAVLAAVQVYRAGFGGWLRRLRLALAGLAGVIAAGLILVSLTYANPLIDSYGPHAASLVLGPQPFDTLLLAYGLPGALMLALALRLRPLAVWPRLRLGVLCAGAGLLAFWIALEIRRFWQGDWLAVPGVRQEELYSYTVALILLGAGLLYQAIASRSVGLRRVAMAVIGLTAAKVFLIDAAGLSGLTRVLSFLGLGLSLAGLAWLNRWAAGRQP